MIERMRMDEPVRPLGSVDQGRPQYASQVHGQGAAAGSGGRVDAATVADGDEGTGGRRRGRWYWIRWSSGMVVIGLVVGLALVAVMKLVNGPVTAGATPDALEAARASAAPTPATNVLSGKSVELSYPSVFDTVANKSNDPGAKGDQYFLSTKGESRTMVVTAFGLPSKQLSDDSSYKFRSMHPELYKVTTVKRGSENVVMMVRTDKTEAILFWVHGDRDLNVALTSSDPGDDLAGYLQTILPTIRWKQ